jgi:hypothetical protein
MEYAVYVAVPAGEDCGLIGRRLLEAVPAGLKYSLRGKSDPSESSDAELAFRIRDVSDQEEALSTALTLYARGREAAGLEPDADARARLAE